MWTSEAVWKDKIVNLTVWMEMLPKKPLCKYHKYSYALIKRLFPTNITNCNLFYFRPFRIFARYFLCTYVLPNKGFTRNVFKKNSTFLSCRICLIDSTMLKWWHTRIVPHRTQLRRFVQPISLSLFHLWPRKVHSCGKWILSTRLNRHVIFCWWCTLSALLNSAMLYYTTLHCTAM